MTTIFKSYSLLSSKEYEELKNDIIEGYLSEYPDREVTDKMIYNDLLLNEELDIDDFIRGYKNVRVEGYIIAIADLGLWHGRRMGYKELGDCITDVLDVYLGDYTSLETDKHNLVGTDCHHDGSNYYTFREVKPNLSQYQIDNFLNLLYSGEAKPKHISYYTRSLKKYIDKYY